MTKKQKISLEDAKVIASKMAREVMGQFWPSDGIDVLSDDFVRGENFWIFFRNPVVDLPEEAWFQRGMGYIVTDYGSSGETIADCRNNPQKLKEAIEGLSKRYREYYQSRV